MKYIKFILALMAISLPSLSWSQINTEDYLPYRDIEATDSGIVVTYTFRGGIQQPDPLHQGAKFWKIPGFGLNDNIAEPGFPFRWDSFTIPDDVEVSITLLDSAYTDTLFTLAPAYPPLLNSDTIGYTPQRVPAIAPYIGFYPNSAVLKGDIQAYRGQGIIRVATLPVHYNYMTGTVRAFSRIKYLVSFTDINTRSTIRGRNYVSERADSHISLSDHFLENTTLNYNLSSNGRRNIQSRTGIEPAELDNRSYLIITTNDFLDAVNEFAEWKRTKGFNVIIESRNSWNNNVDSVKNVIRNHYNTNNNLHYLLIVGEANKVPTCHYINVINEMYSESVSTDFPYVCLSDTFDYTSDILFGRITAVSNNEAQHVFDKIYNYEKNPNDDSDFYNTVTCVSMFQDNEDSLFNNIPDSYEDSRAIRTTEEIINYLSTKLKTCNRVYNRMGNYLLPRYYNNVFYSNGELLPNQLLNNFYWNGSATDIKNYINHGTFLLSFIGHSSITQWALPSFSSNEIALLTNSNKYPVIFSMGCSSGTFDYNTDGIAEQFLKKPNAGAVAVIAPTRDTYFGFTEMIDEYFIDAIWPNPGLSIHWKYDQQDSLEIKEPVYELGAVLNQSMHKMSCFNMEMTDSVKNLLNYPDQHDYIYNYQLHRRMYHLFGDPSMRIYTKQPTEISNPTINVNGNTIHVETTLSKARISFYTPGTTPVVDSYLGNSVDYTTIADSVIICIDRQNCIPHIVTYRRNEFIQNETISDARTYVGKNIKIGRNVTNTKPVGDVVINGADLLIQGGNVELHPGTTIINSNVLINPQ